MPGSVNIPVWDGDPNNLPDLWQKFLYNGGEHVIAITPEGKKYVTDRTGVPDLDMAIRMFPGRTGSVPLDVLFKSGLFTVDEIVAVTDDDGRVLDMIEKFADHVLKQEDMAAWLGERKITKEELKATKAYVAGLVYMANALLLALLLD